MNSNYNENASDSFEDLEDIENLAAPDAPAAPVRARKNKRSFVGIKPQHRWLIVLVSIIFLAVNFGVITYFGIELYYVAALRLDSERLELFEGDELTLSPEIVAFGFGEAELSWTSSDKAVLSASDGTVLALAPGSAVVTVTEKGSGVNTNCEVVVRAVNEMVLDVTDLTLGEGETHTLSVRLGSSSDSAPQYTSSDTAVAAVSEDGVITALSVGKAVITASLRGFSDEQCSVEVLSPPSVIELSSDGAVCVGEKRSLTVSMSDLEHSSVILYTCETPEIATIDEKGLLTTLAKGTAVVTATAYNGVSAQLKVEVDGTPALVYAPDKQVAYNGIPLTVYPTDNTGNCREYYFVSSNPEILSIDEHGVFHAHRRGKVEVTCTSYNGVSSTFKVDSRIVDYTTEYSSDRVYLNIESLAAQYPDIINTESIGKSVQGRDITLLRFGSGERKVCIIAGIHSKENISISFTMRCIEEIADALANGKKYAGYNVEKLFSEFTIYFVPMMNPDGLDIAQGLCLPEYTSTPLTEEEMKKFKNNANGVNLNRNSPFLWGMEGLNTTVPDVNSFTGSAAASEPEMVAVMELCRANEFEWLFSMHSKGHMLFYQDVVNEVTEQDNKIASRFDRVCEFTLNDRSSKMEISGGLENWFRSEFGRTGLCVELVPSKYSDAVNYYFDTKTNWVTTKCIFLMCLGL